jgi:hypothetical protein
MNLPPYLGEINILNLTNVYSTILNIFNPQFNSNKNKILSSIAISVNVKVRFSSSSFIYFKKLFDGINLTNKFLSSNT